MNTHTKDNSARNIENSALCLCKQAANGHSIEVLHIISKSVVIAMIAWLLDPACLAQTAPTASLPLLTEELRPINEKPDPSFEDARLTIQALTTKSAACSNVGERTAVSQFIEQIKQPFIAEAGYLQLVALGPKIKEKINEFENKLADVKKNPPRRTGGEVDVRLQGLMEIEYKKKIAEAQVAMSEVNSAPRKLAAQLATTNSTAAAYLRAGRQDAALALASSMFAVAARYYLSLDFTPALGYAWVKMKKLTPVQRQVEQERARKLLVGYVALHEGAKAISSMSADVLYQSAKTGDLSGSVLSYVLLQEGLAEQRKNDAMIDFCLEVVFFQPQPSDYSARMRLVLNRILAPAAAKPARERFTAVFVRETIVAISPELGTPVVADTMSSILLAGLEQASSK